MNRRSFLINSAIFLVGCGKMGLSPGDGNGYTTKYWAYGDSITDGSGVTSYARMVADTNGWNLENRSFGGSRIADAEQKTRALTDSIAYRDVVTILTGYNDMRFVGNDSGEIATYAGHLNDILTHWSNIGCTVYVGNCLTMPAASYSQNSPYDQGSDAAVTAFNVAIAAEVAKFSNATLVDTSSYDPDTVGYTQVDGVHPTLIGQEYIRDLFLAEM